MVENKNKLTCIGAHREIKHYYIEKYIVYRQNIVQGLLKHDYFQFVIWHL